MKQKKLSNYAFIDSQNLNLSIQRLKWKLHFKNFRTYIKEKYQVGKAFLFIGYLKKNVNLYESLKADGYSIIFKPTLEYRKGKTTKTKGNVDAELVLHTIIRLQKFDKAVIVTGDGDFYCFVDYLAKKRKLKKLLVPDQRRYSALLKRLDSKYLAFISDQKNKLAVKKRKELQKDQPLRSAFRRDSKLNISRKTNKVKHKKWRGT